MTTLNGTPASLGFRMPAEWEPHEATWLVWPHQRNDWPGKFHSIPWAYAEIIRKLVEGERVVLLTASEGSARRARRILKRVGADLNQVEILVFPTDRGWTRDIGPFFVRDGRENLAIIDWEFNGWAKYPNHHSDNQVAAFAARTLEAPLFEPSVDGRLMVLEGGAIDVNGAGCVLTTEECLLSPVQARNPELGREQIERMLREYLGVEQVLWLKHGIAGDDTHGHIDDLARFVNPSTIVIAREEDPADVNFEPLRENFEIASGFRDAEGRPFQIVALPMPRPLYFRGIRLPASYANFYIANRYVLVPTFNDPNDRMALNILANLFADRMVTGIHAVDLVWGLGTLHCLTQQQPRGQFSP